jgi:hypothetical protein
MNTEASFVKKKLSIFGRCITWFPVKDRIQFGDNSLLVLTDYGIVMISDLFKSTYKCNIGKSWASVSGLVETDCWAIDFGSQSNKDCFTVKFSEKVICVSCLVGEVDLFGSTIHFPFTWFDYKAFITCHDDSLFDLAKIVAARVLFYKWKNNLHSTSL